VIWFIGKVVTSCSNMPLPVVPNDSIKPLAEVVWVIEVCAALSIWRTSCFVGEKFSIVSRPLPTW
jgi:hypothetical protein